ncbi:MAG: hypothetical protein HUU30_18380 [Burkholderiaceae bacterium]|nr:NucA/NucB deoxyribonuclease domain-containing protein [Aquabacterium sp.]NUP87700.1 hypothetical protein [Burkholderiaceae bacterium]
MRQVPISITLALLASLAAACAEAAPQATHPRKTPLVRWVYDPAIPRPEQPTGGTDRGGNVLAASDEVPCTDSDFRTVPIGGHPGAVLMSRHKYCQQYVSSPTMISVDLMRRTDDSAWEFYRPGVPAAKISTHDVGTLVIETRVHAYGGSNRLGKTHKIDVSAQSFVFDPGFPAHLQPGIFVTLQPNGGTTMPTNSGVRGFEVNTSEIGLITLSAASHSGSTGAFDVNFKWSYEGQDPQGNITQFAVYAPSYAYSVNGTPRRDTTGVFNIDADSSASWLFPQGLRCDKGVATGDGTPSEGCIFEEAAPVFRISATGSVAEEALHVFQAQTTTDAYRTERSPGVFLPVPGTRVVADEPGDPQYMGLIRGTLEDSILNRDAACVLPNSLAAIRPYSGSSSCPTPQSPNCSCDEFPFAITKNGAAYNPSGTSVRYINLDHNRTGGSLLSGFFRTERVIPNEKFWVQVTDIH